jgi:exoribonuclease R
MALNLWNSIFNNNFNDINNNIHNEYPLILDPIYGLSEKRIDYKHLEIYSIDPENCTDADDAFSIYHENNNIHLLIHIADPTAWFNPNDSLFNDIINNGTTIYLSNKEPDHLFPSGILENSTLTHGIRNVLIVHTIMNQHDYHNDIISSKIEYGIINCDNGKRFSYESAANYINNININNTLSLGLNIAAIFKSKRNCILNDLSLTIPYIVDNEVILKPDTQEVRLMKNMIAEFAIHANTIFAQELDINNLFVRKLELNNNNYNNIHDLIENEISAKYTNENKKHDLIGTNQNYTHSTSPLRRTADCIVHFLLKAKFLNIDPPFTYEQLEKYAEHLNKKTKESKNIQFKDIKLRTFQWIAEELESRLNPIKIKIKSMGIKNIFINLMIIKIDNMDVNIPYTIRNKKKLTSIPFEEKDINITKINNYNKYDEGTLPEIDNILKNHKK